MNTNKSKKLYLLTYDLNKEKGVTIDYRELYKLLETYEHNKVTESTYAIYSDEEDYVILGKFSARVDKNDVLVVSLVTSVRSYNVSGSQWIQDRLPKLETKN